MRRFLSTAALLLIAPQASAHIVLAHPIAVPGSYYAGFFRVSHGCGTSGTVSLRIEIPKEIASARPQPKAGWMLFVETERLETPVKSESGTITTRVKAITWKGDLPADQFDQFGVMMKLPAQFTPLYFPAVQTCISGENRWTDIPADNQAWHDVPHPAPVLNLEEPENMPGKKNTGMTHNH